MPHHFAEIAFTERVRALQEARGSRKSYARFDEAEESLNGALGPAEAAFLAERDSFYMASVSETGWPYVQHRGGPLGFVRVLDEKTLGFADFAGNKQYVSLGNLCGDPRVSLFFMDYANRRRLKLFGRVEVVGNNDEVLAARLHDHNYRARVERLIRIHVEGFDWNCPQHITPRYTLVEVERATEGLRARIVELEAALAACKGQQGQGGPALPDAGGDRSA